MRIALLSDHFPPDQSGGAARSAFNQARALARLGYEVHVLSTRQSASEPQDVVIEGIPVRRALLAYPLRWRAYLSLYHPRADAAVAAFLGHVCPDIVHAHNIHTYLTYHSFALARWRHVPVVLTTHDVMPVTYQKFEDFIPEMIRTGRVDYRVHALKDFARHRLRYFPLRNAIIRSQIGRHVDLLISPSRALLEVFAANGVAAAHNVCLPNGIDPAEFESSAGEQAAFRHRFRLEERKLILFAGRASREKGAGVLLNALPEIAAHVPGAVLLVLAPEGGSSVSIRRQAESLGVADRLVFTGWLHGPELAAAFGAADVCVTPSICFDNFPTVNLEAQAAGTPVVTTCFGGAPETIEEGQTGLAVNPLIPGQLADAVCRVLGDDALHAGMGQRGQAFAREHFDWLAQAKRLGELYQQVLDSTI
ncbi:MAG: glycosyltransferase family 4 protein [Anaerolineae bacterium]|nr:glycosyltransferase family 4 protein [Anaerolineae bacterium]